MPVYKKTFLVGGRQGAFNHQSSWKDIAQQFGTVEVTAASRAPGLARATDLSTAVALAAAVFTQGNSPTSG